MLQSCTACTTDLHCCVVVFHRPACMLQCTDMCCHGVVVAHEYLMQIFVKTVVCCCPLQPAMDEVSLLQLGPPKYKVAYLTTPQQHSNITKQQQYQQQLAAAPDPATAEQIREQQLIEEAAAAAVAFRAVAAEASGMNSSSTSTSAAPGLAAGTPKQDTSPCYGPWQPFMAPLVVNQRVTAADHFQDTRHIEFDLEGSGLSYEPGDLLCIFPRTPAADVEVKLAQDCGNEIGSAAGVTHMSLWHQ